MDNGEKKNRKQSGSRGRNDGQKMKEGKGGQGKRGVGDEEGKMEVEKEWGSEQGRVFS